MDLCTMVPCTLGIYTVNLTVLKIVNKCVFLDLKKLTLCTQGLPYF